MTTVCLIKTTFEASIPSIATGCDRARYRYLMKALNGTKAPL